MKTKSLLLVLALVVGAFVSNAQMVVKGDKIANFGLGLGSTLYSGSYYKGVVPPISVSGEYVFMDGLLEDKAAIGLGGYLGYSSYKYEYAFYDWKWKYNSIIIGPRGYFHYNFLDKLDTYTGLLLGYNILSEKFTGSGEHDGHSESGGVAWSWFIGGRYYINDNFAVMAELGYGVAYLNIGVAIKL